MADLNKHQKLSRQNKKSLEKLFFCLNEVQIDAREDEELSAFLQKIKDIVSELLDHSINRDAEAEKKLVERIQEIQRLSPNGGKRKPPFNPGSYEDLEESSQGYGSAY